MKKFSWEIIVAGLLFIFVAIYLLGKPSKKDASSTALVTVVPTPEDAAEPEMVHTIDLKKLEELAVLKELENIAELDELELLESLKEMAHLLPSEIRDDFQLEIEKALSELSNNEISIDLDLTEKLIIVNRDSKLEQGKWTGSSPGVYTYLNEFDASSVENVVLKLPYGSITIVGSEDGKSSLTLHASGQISSTQDLESQLSTISHFSNEAVFKIEPKNSIVDHNIQLQAVLSIPTKMEVVTETMTGHIEISNIQGEQVYKTGGGHIILNNIQGDVTAISEGGHITLENGVGEFLIKSGGGHLKATNSSGEFFLKTSGGNIEALDVEGELAASTQGGNISILMKKFTKDISAETSAGNIQILLPSSTNANIELKASSLVEVTGITFDGTKKKTNLKGTLNSGGPDIIAYSKYGQVAVKSND